MEAMVRFSVADIIISKADMPKAAVVGNAPYQLSIPQNSEIYATPNTPTQAWPVFMCTRHLFLRCSPVGHRVW